MTEHDTVTEPDASLRDRTHRGGAHRAPRPASGVRKYRIPTARMTKVSAAPAGGGPAPDRPGGARPRSRVRLARLSAGVVVLAGLVGVGLARPGVPSAEPTVTQFLIDWQSRHFLAAAELTNGPPAAVAAKLASAYQRLDASDLSLAMTGVSQHGKTATADFEASIDLGDSGLTWSYGNSFALADGSGGWRVRWSPSVIVPGMTDREQLAVISNLPTRQQVLDSAGKSLEVRSKIYQVGVYPGHLHDLALTANELGDLTGIQPSQIQGQMQESLPGNFLSLLTLTPRQYARMRAGLSGIPGIVVKPGTEQLFNSIAPDVVGSVGTEMAPSLKLNGEPYRPGTTVGESGLQLTFQRQLTGSAGTEVVLQQAGKPAVLLKSWHRTLGKPVRTTLNSTIQTAADKALSGQLGSAAIVAVQASTGKILAVASRKADNLPALYPLAGKYEAGQAFTIISSAALLAGARVGGGTQLSLSSPIPCPASNGPNGSTFVNDPPVHGIGGSPSFQSDFAHGCSTAFVGMPVSSVDLQRASQEFGIGGWSLPLSDSFTGAPSAAGQLGQISSGSQRAAAVIGLGGVRVSPLGMALAAAVVESGRWHTPSLVTGSGDPHSEPAATASAQVLSELRALMHASATTASNSVADVGGNVYGQAGNAPYAGKRVRISWFVGYENGIAFAIAELSKSPTTSAAPLAGSFLHLVRAGS